MKLNTIKNVNQTMKALDAKRIQKYAKLCTIYEKLANYLVSHSKNDILATDITERYSEVLSAVSYNDVENIDILAEKGYYSTEEVNLFKQFSEASQQLLNYTRAREYLKTSKSDDSPKIDSEKIEKFEKFMQSNGKDEQEFYNDIHYHNSFTVGNHFWELSQRSANQIYNIDKHHLNIPIDSLTSKLSRKSFGGNDLITGNPSLIGNIDSILYNANPDIEITGDNLINQSNKNYKSNKYTRKVTTLDKIADTTYTAKTVASDEIKQKINKLPLKQLAKTASIFATVGLLATVSVSSTLGKTDYSAINNSRNGYETNVTQNTIQELMDIQQLIEAAQYSDSIPSKQDLITIVDRLDSVNTSIVQDLTINAYSQVHPEYSNISVSPEYKIGNKQRHDSITISYVNENNEPMTTEIKSFDSEINNSFSLEASYDDLKNSISDIFDDTTSTYTEKAKKIDNLLSKFSSIHKDLDTLGGREFVYKDGVLWDSLKAEKPNQTDEKTIDDDDDRDI